MRMLFTFITAVAFLVGVAGQASATSITKAKKPSKSPDLVMADLKDKLTKFGHELPDFAKGADAGKHLGWDKGKGPDWDKFEDKITEGKWKKSFHPFFAKLDHVTLDKDGNVKDDGKGGDGKDGGKPPPITKVPESGTTVLLGAALLGITAARRSRREA